MHICNNIQSMACLVHAQNGLTTEQSDAYLIYAVLY